MKTTYEIGDKFATIRELELNDIVFPEGTIFEVMARGIDLGLDEDDYELYFNNEEDETRGTVEVMTFDEIEAMIAIGISDN